jgi:excinuclease UvrABC nuclease subunit
MKEQIILSVPSYTLEEIISKKTNYEFISGVYFLLDKNEVVYVGQSECVQHRIATHKKEKKKVFDTYTYFEIEGLNNRLIAEGLHIYQLRPKYNSIDRVDNWVKKSVEVILTNKKDG